MNRIILGAFVAFIFSLCVFVSLVAFHASGEGIFAIVAVFFAFAVFGGVAMAIEETKWFDRIADIFAGEEASHE